jgi:hypothetical protein
MQFEITGGCICKVGTGSGPGNGGASRGFRKCSSGCGSFQDVNSLRLDMSLRPENVLSRAMSGEVANWWFEQFEAYLEWNQDWPDAIILRNED